MRLSVKFYLVAMFFVIFDVEALIPVCLIGLGSRERLGRLYRSRHFHFGAIGPVWFIWCASARWLDSARSQRRSKPSTITNTNSHPQ